MRRPRRVSIEVLTERVDQFNKLPIGTAVEYHSVIDEPGHVVTKTRSAAWILSGHSPVVLVDGVSGCVHLDAVKVIKPNDELTEKQLAVVDTLWPHLPRVPEHPDRRMVSADFGTKTKLGLYRTLLRMIDEAEGRR